MFKYAFTITHNKTASKAIVKNCLLKYNRQIAWIDKGKARRQQQTVIRTACYGWLHTEILKLIKQQRHPVYPPPGHFIDQLTENN